MFQKCLDCTETSMLSMSVKNIDVQNWVEELKTGWIVSICTEKQKLENSLWTFFNHKLALFTQPPKPKE